MWPQRVCVCVCVCVLKQDKETLKLHATLINTSHVKSGNTTTGASTAATDTDPQTTNTTDTTEALINAATQGLTSGGSKKSPRFGKRVLLDVRDLLALDVDMGTHTLGSLHVSQRYKYDTNTGYYHSVAAIDLPK